MAHTKIMPQIIMKPTANHDEYATVVLKPRKISRQHCIQNPAMDLHH